MRKKNKKPLRPEDRPPSSRTGSYEIFSAQQPEFTILKTQL